MGDLRRRILAAFEILFLPPPPILGGTVGPPGPEDMERMRKQARSHLEQHLAHHIFVEMVGDFALPLGKTEASSDEHILEVAAFARRAARLYANEEEFPG